MSLKPVLIGLPGAGKSSIAKILSQRTGLDVVSTDALFRVYRAIPANDPRPESAIMQNFLARAETEFPAHHPQLLKTATMIDDKGRCALHDSTLFRGFGEDVFRTFEIEMNKWLYIQGKFDQSLPDLSASAPLYDENRAIFSPKNGFKIILLDTPHDLIVVRLLMDYLEHRRLSEEQGTNVPLRGAYEMAVNAALAQEPERDPKDVVMATLAQTSLADRQKRMAQYHGFAHAVITPQPGQTPDDLANIVEALLAV